MHNLWMGYMSELLGLSRYSASVSCPQTMPGSSAMHPKLLKADFHGSIMTGLSLCIFSIGLLTIPIVVHKAKNPCLVGISGIVIHETENAFKVVTPQDKVKGTIAVSFTEPSSPYFCYSHSKTKLHIHLCCTPLFNTTCNTQAGHAAPTAFSVQWVCTNEDRFRRPIHGV